MPHEPVSVHVPSNGGFDSGSRSYARFITTNDVTRRSVRPAAAVLLTLQTGDLLTVINKDGGTAALLIPFDPQGSNALSALGLANVMPTSLSTESHDHTAITQWLRSQGGLATSASPKVTGYQIFNKQTLSGEQFTLNIRQPIKLWVSIVTERSSVGYGGAGGCMHVDVKPANQSTVNLPDPLGAIRDEFTVSRGTAQAYQVKAGETIQIIDVEGRQCSDFMALRADALERGDERTIDSTVTRSMTGGAYPGPGLFDKFFDQDLRPLLKLTQDTVGRHDTFAYACTARGYEERGFFGHLNCSDNISAVYEPYGIKRRAAWPAINFFFNSWILPQDNRIRSDEAWSQAGDYVALQAMTDLVCVSTACPDDVDPINGWNPTDIHVRVYQPEAKIKRAVAYRMTPNAEPILTEQTAFHPRTSELTRHFAVARDVWSPMSFEATRALEEYTACRQAVTVQDMSSLRKFDVLGPDAEVLLQAALTRDVKKLSTNRGLYALLCDETGAVIDGGTLFRLTADSFRWCCGSDESARHFKQLAETMALNVWIKSLFSAMPNLAIQGPLSRELLQRITFTQPTHTAVENLKWFGCTVARLHDREGYPFLLTRTGYTGELGFEIFCDVAAALPLWDAIMTAGDDLDITPMGNEALEIMRIEAGLMAAGAEFTADVDAYEAGLGFAVDLKKTDFVGRAALARNHASPRRQLIGLRLAGDEVPLHGDGVYVGERQVGVVTSAVRSPALGCAIAMARVATEFSDTEQDLEVGKLDGRMKRLKAAVHSIPFVDPQRKRARS